jgi:hypothetical protein
MYGGEREMIVKEAMVMYLRSTDKSPGQNGISGTITMESEGVATQVGQQDEGLQQRVLNPVQPSFTAPNGTQPIWAAAAAAVHGTAIGATLVSNSPDFVISGISIAYRDVVGIFG